MKPSKHNVDTGKLLRNFIEKRRMSAAELGRDINRNGTSIFKYKENISIQTGILIEICHATKHNFFQDIADGMPGDFTVSNNLQSEKDLVIAQLEEENKRLKMENEILMRLRG